MRALGLASQARAHRFFFSSHDQSGIGIFGRMLEALHDSRKLQAQRFLKDYRHLFEEHQSPRDEATETFRRQTMPVDDVALRAGSKRPNFAGSRAAVVAILAAFLIMHLMAVLSLQQSAPVKNGIEEQVLGQLRD